MQHGKGQYFTTNKYLKKSIHSLVLNNPSKILEPSVGRGDLVKYFLKKDKNIKFDMYEIDSDIKPLKRIGKITYCDFLTHKTNKTYKTIIGNPPYVKTTSGNLYIKFIEKCYGLLKSKGELIFIVPSDFLKITGSAKLLQEMLKEGTFTHILHPHDEKLFENASIDVIIFRYCKDPKLPNKLKYNGDIKYLINCNGTLTLSDTDLKDMKRLKDNFNVFVGIVSGKESVFKSDIGNVKVLNKENQIDKYILLDSFPSDNKKINKHMLKHKAELMTRKIRKFNKDNWYQWGALRNYKTVNENLDKDCIYIKTLTRDSKIAFVGKVSLFGGGLIMIMPRKSMTIKKLNKLVNYMNSAKFKQNYTYAGRFKIGHRQIENILY